MKKRLWLKILLGIVAAILLILAALVGYLTVTEYRPEERKTAEQMHIDNGTAVSAGEKMTFYSWNIGYAGLDSSADFFMDGGSEVNPELENVERNLSQIKAFISSHDADAWFLQEVDVHSARTGHINELEAISEAYQGSYGLAYNYKCSFVPIPLPPIGEIESGIAIFTDRSVKSLLVSSRN